ncbi:MAG: tail fiber domain-containing protein [Terracidiphilus sp.]|jgi:hypothetical protein
MKNIGIAILAVCLATLGSMVAQAQTNNTAYGSGALQSNTTGNSNSAFGASALQSNTNGTQNSALGASALSSNTSGSDNTAVGLSSLNLNNTGADNSAFGAQSLAYNTSGSVNTAIGYGSLYSNATGWINTAVGAFALNNNTSGFYNIGIGYAAGTNNPPGASNNIDIGSYGSASDYNVIRIGNSAVQLALYVAGVDGIAISNPVPVYINGGGQLGTVNSSIRFKEDIHDMAAVSEGLMRLRPVTFRYKQPYEDGSKPIDYGLIAEEVAEVYPDLVARDAEGKILTVQYQKLTPMLLNELQKEHKLLDEQTATIQQQEEEILQQERSAAEQAEINQRLEKRLAALEAALPSAGPQTQLVTK